MKKITVLVAACFAFASCNVSVGTNTDLKTGLSVSYNGFRIGESGLLDKDGQKKSNNQVLFGDEIAIVVAGVENYKLKDGRAFPGLDLVVTDKDGVVVLEGRDILAKDDGYVPAEASTLSGTITAGTPMRAGET